MTTLVEIGVSGVDKNAIDEKTRKKLARHRRPYSR